MTRWLEMTRRFEVENRWPAWAQALGIAVLAFGGFGVLFARFPVLYDTDSYYHLAISRLYAHQGVVDILPWARLSLLFDGFGDKEFLFHLLGAPFAAGDAVPLGGRLGLAFWNAVLCGLLAWLGVRAIGSWGLLVPLAIYAGSLDFFGRAIRLRPELLSLILILVAIHCAGRGRYRLLGVVLALYTLSYTAFQALLGLTFLWFAERGLRRGRWSLELLLYPVAGVLFGLVVHPHFPHNLTIWKVQNVDFFALKDTLDVGTEIGSRTGAELLEMNAVWLLGLLVIWLASRRRGGAVTPEVDRLTAALHLTTAAFGVLYLLMGRFSIYFVPLATLSLVWELRRRGLVIGPRVAIPGAGRASPALPTALLLGLVALWGLGRTGALLADLLEDSGSVSREAEWATFGRAVPPGARVAAEWGSTHLYMFWAPQGTYLNVLDPIFMALPHPDAYAALRRVFEGREPDVPFAVASQLESDHLALSRFHPHPRLLDRLAGDSRLVARHEGYTLLYGLEAGKNDDFVFGWRVTSADRPPPIRRQEIARLPEYPRAPTAELRAIEGFVDLDRTGLAGDCFYLFHEELVHETELRSYELAPYGPTTFWINGHPQIASEATPGAVLGEGFLLNVELEPSRHRFMILTCRGNDGEGRTGFYLRRRDGGAQEMETP